MENFNFLCSVRVIMFWPFSPFIDIVFETFFASVDIFHVSRLSLIQFDIHFGKSVPIHKVSK